MPFLQILSKLPVERGNVKAGQHAGDKSCHIDPQNQVTGIRQSSHPWRMDPRGCSRGLGTSLRHTSYFKPPVTRLGRALRHLQTGMGKGFALAVTARTDTARHEGCWPASFSGRGCPDSWDLTPARSVVTVLSQQQGGSGSPWKLPVVSWRHLLPPRSFAVLKEDSCTSPVDRP